MYNDLSPRKKAILKAVIDSHIDNGEPVGSKALTKTSRFELSSATIRNEMAELESMGYLIQPHTSAGRVPTELGYRFYVDSLMQDYDLTSREIEELNRVLRAKTAELDRLISDASKVVSSLTNYTAIALSPGKTGRGAIRFSITPVDQRSFLLVVVLEKNSAKTKFINTETYIPEYILKKLEDLLNTYVAGRDLKEITISQMMEMESRLGDYASLVSPIIKYVWEIVSSDSRGEIKIDGVDRLLEYPEYSDVSKLRDVLSLMNRKNELFELVSEDEGSDISVYIGKENAMDAMNGSSVVFKKITVNGEVVGAIGVIGPCRMDYSKVISTIRYLSENIEERFFELTEGGKQDEN